MSGLGPSLVYSLCLLTSIMCAWLLARRYRERGSRLLLSFALVFAAFAVNNLLLVADMLLLPNVDLWPLRQFALAVGVVVMIHGCLAERQP